MDPLGIYDFAALPLSDRLAMVWEHGNFIANVLDGGNGYALYFLSGYFVEVEMTEQADTMHITDAVPFRTGDRLNKYLAQVDLSEWVNAR